MLRILATLVLVTLLAFAEVSLKAPWSPLLVFYGVLIITLPLLFAKHRQLGLVRPVSLLRAIFFVAVFFQIYFVYQWVVGYAYQLYLASLQSPPPSELVDLSAAQQTAVHVSVTRAAEVVSAAIPAPVSPSLIVALIPWATLVYAPIGEELFYRGFGYAQLAERSSFLFSSSLSSLLFAVRHSIQLLVVTPTPWAASLYWFGLAVPFGYFASYILKKTTSLFPAIALHFLVNLTSTFAT